MASPETDIRQRLADLGRQRKAHERTEGELAVEVEKALGDAYGIVSISEAARLLGMHRTTIYRVYHPHDG
jgi:transcriptional regulator of acetoin/glycerol metabolism